MHKLRGMPKRVPVALVGRRTCYGHIELNSRSEPCPSRPKLRTVRSPVAEAPFTAASAEPRKPECRLFEKR